MSNWKKTEIWQKLSKMKSDQGEKVKSFLQADFCMERIEKILSSGSTSPKDFTLHDADHSFRVSQRMWEIIPENTKKILSEYELAFLLLSAYLHDIGMTPEYKKVKNHYQILNTTLKEDLLTPIERQDFQKWLDEEGEQINIEKDTLNDEGKAAELVTFYCRYKHNDWSEEWIRKNFEDKVFANYTNWLNDLVSICRSHHFGLNELKLDKFDPLRIHGKVIHKRYIAMCLRLADVIEIDPERAPDVLMRHRGVINGSLSHWLKEKFTSIDIVNNCISISANPPQAFIHKAIIDVSDQIEHETNLCNTLKGEIPLRNISPSNDLKHEWNILPTVYRGIKEAGNYEFIDGTFRPNSKKLLQLLAGTELYGDPMLALREIIQNSLDAIKIQLAYKVLEDEDIKPEQVELLKEKFKIELAVQREDNEYWIICNDNGVGMDKETIKKCFLVGGATKRHELLELERNCNRIGYNLDLTGRFGIGVMSYFMISDKMIIETKKSYQSTIHEANGWEFEINGLSDFGELRKSSRATIGTTIRLRVKEEFTSIIEEDTTIINFLEHTLNKIPCNFIFKSLNKKELKYTPGWCKDQVFFKKELIKLFKNATIAQKNPAADYLTEEQNNLINTSNKRKTQVVDNLADTIEFLVTEGELKNHNGLFRIHVPVFKNKKGASFAIFFEKKDDETLLVAINEGMLFLPEIKTTIISWKGITINCYEEHRSSFPYRNCFIELDLNNEATFQISVSRLEIAYQDKLSTIIDEIKHSIDDLIVARATRFINSNYYVFNHIVADCLPPKQDNFYWVLESSYKKDFIKFEKIKFPVVFDINNSPFVKDHLFRGKEISRTDRLKGLGYRNMERETFEIEYSKYKLDRAVYDPDNRFKISFLVLDTFTTNRNISGIANSCNFPPQWKKLLCVRGYSPTDLVLNESSPYFKYVNEEDFLYVEMFFKEKKSLKGYDGDRILESTSKSFCFLLYLISINQKSYWDALVKNHTSFVKKLWSKMFENDDETLYFFFDDLTSRDLISISTNDWKITEGKKEIIEILPIPDIEWTIVREEKHG